ncbi:MAG TPA: caspase family protein [Desulfatiglandales bacterium]|nr:caspase family protein [Desulfatiglandales bacterium]
MAQTTEPILRTELGTHNATIFSIATDPSNRILVTGSEDKTVRVWDISDGVRLLRILRPPVARWEQGQIFAVALSPDGRTVAIGGRTGNPKQGDACVYLFDRATGVLTRRLGGLPGWIQNLVYTPDGRFLVAVTGERGGKVSWAGMSIFRLPDYALVAEDRDYGNLIRGIESSPSGSLLATTCFDGFVRLYDLSALKAEDASLPRPIAPVSKVRPPGGQRPWELSFSPDGTRLAVGFNLIPKVDVLEIKGNTLEHAYSPDTTGVVASRGVDFRTVAWSSDGRFLYAGGGYRLKKVFQVRKWDDGGRGEYMDLPIPVELHLFQLLSLRAGGVAFCGQDGSFGTINNRDEAIFLSPKAIPTYVGNYHGFLLSPDGSAIQFAYERRGESPALFSVNERRLTDAYLWAGLKASFTFQAPITKGLEVSDWDTSLSPKLRGKPLKLKQELAKSLAIKPDRSGFLLGTTIALWLFDSSGTVLWWVRMPGAVWGVNTNGKVAVAALSDGTIRWYRVSDGKEILAFFPHPDRKRWVLWTPSGYYDASPGGEDFIGWHVNNGREQAADFFPASRFRSTYYRPDVIDRVLKTLDEQEALRLANEEASRKQVPAVSLREKLPPVVSILSPADGTEVSTPSVIIRYSARTHDPITAIRVLVDGRPVSAEGARKLVKESGECSVTIPQRDCDVSVIAYNRFAASEPATIRLRWKGAIAQEKFEIKPKLYVLAVGVSTYQDAGLRLDLAAKDALDFGAAWNEQKGRLYSGVEVRALTDAQATKGNILDGLEWLQRQVTSKDVAVLFFAGHGINDPMGAFYFLPVEADVEKLKRTGISQADITSTVASIAGKVLVFMDACHSGNLMGKLKRRGLVVVSAVVNELASAENGAVVFSSATGRQYALENMEWGNGAFTKAAVEGIRGKADYKSTGRITLNMLDLYVSERVKELTKGQQTPTTVKPPNVPDFPVAVLR